MDNILSWNYSTKKTQVCSGKCFFSILIYFLIKLKRYELHVRFILDMFTCCLMHNLFRSKDEENINRLCHIIELEANTREEGQNNKIDVITCDDNVNQSQIEGLEHSRDAIRRELIQYLGRQITLFDLVIQNIPPMCFFVF